MKAHIMRSGRALLTICVFVSNSVNALPIHNLGFESGLDGYQFEGKVTSEFKTKAADNTFYQPTEGNWFIRLDAKGTSTEAYGGTDGAILTTDISLMAGQSLSFDWAFLGFDFLDYMDFALFSADRDILLADMSFVGNRGDTGWQSFNWSPLTEYSGNIHFVVSNDGDDRFDSALLLDNLRISGLSAGELPGATRIPEPNILALCAVGLLVFGAGRRISRKG